MMSLYIFMFNIVISRSLHIFLIRITIDLCSKPREEWITILWQEALKLLIFFMDLLWTFIYQQAQNQISRDFKVVRGNMPYFAWILREALQDHYSTMMQKL